MKLLMLNPKRLFRSNKKKPTRSISRSDGSFSSSSDGSSSSLGGVKGEAGKETPTTVLPIERESGGGWTELVEAFKMMDRDGDGKITKEELEALLCRVGGACPPTPEELAIMLTEVDRDGDGCISLEEFGAVSSAFGPPACDSELRDAFNFFDADHDGCITAEELHAVFSSLGDERCTLAECRRMISGVDVNGEGFVCFDDFVRMMEQQINIGNNLSD